MTFEAERAPGGSSEGDVGCTYVATKLKWRIRAGELRIGKANMSWRTLYDVPKKHYKYWINCCKNSSSSKSLLGMLGHVSRRVYELWLYE